jgi:pilus assembly protein CpaF
MAGLINGVGVRTTGEADLAAAELRTTDGYQRTKFAIFNLVLEQLEALGITAETAPASMIRDGVEQGITRFAAKEGLALNAAERSLLAAEVHNEVVGLGPLEPLLKDPSIDDVIVNGPFRIFVERGGQLSAVPARFRDTAHLMNIIQRIVSPIGRRVDEATPYVDARLPDGSRVNVVIPPIAGRASTS